ncbi:hypothetical protein [Allokutzneria sp. NRRL B-24872]|uniref:hypothetical protein n=1 Tax=Allokutzneria sp. NRRL B-24872 TaxID=1137961 RepID=UPI00352E0647
MTLTLPPEQGLQEMTAVARRPSTVWLNQLTVDPAHQGRGLRCTSGGVSNGATSCSGRGKPAAAQCSRDRSVPPRRPRIRAWRSSPPASTST